MPTLEDLTVDQLLATAKQMQGSHNLVETLSKNPETRESLLRLMKKIEPTRVIPEIDSVDHVRAELAADRDRVNKLEEKYIERDLRERLERERAKAQSDFKLTDADMIEVQKLMTSENANERIPSYNAAARVVAASKVNAVPTSIGAKPPVFEMPDKDVWGPGIGNKAKLDKIGLEQAFVAWNEVTGAKAA
jgi:hypothetical protein